MLPALALGAEPPSPPSCDARRGPRSASARCGPAGPGLWFSGGARSRGCDGGILLRARSRGMEHGRSMLRTIRLFPVYLQATTACLSAIVVMQIVNVFLCRSERESVLAAELRSNRLILVGIAAELLLILAIDYTPWGNRCSAPHRLDSMAVRHPVRCRDADSRRSSQILVRAVSATGRNAKGWAITVAGHVGSMGPRASMSPAPRLPGADLTSRCGGCNRPGPGCDCGQRPPG